RPVELARWLMEFVALTVTVPEYVPDERGFEAHSRRHSTSGAFFARSRPEQNAAADDAVRAAGCFSGFDPASDEAIAALRVPAAGEMREDGCAVCLEDFEGGGDDKLRAMPCSHCFHQRCIFRWLSVSRVCPCCRFPLPSADEQRLLVLDEQATGPNARAE
uniref:RING-type domain-containing protein n=1 Tax=Aegilops tauschii subsp. strangulata TaxID=200361 RepID=A0A453HRK6_AEGTS